MKKSLVLLAGAIFMLTGAMTLTSCGENNGSDNTSVTKTNIKVNIAGPSTVEVDSQIKLDITLENDNNRKGYTVTSSNDAVATVDNEGNVRGLSIGEVTITVTSREDATAKAEHKVTVTASSKPTLKITTASDTIKFGSGTVVFNAEVTNPKGDEIIYEWTIKNGKGSFVGKNNTQSVTFRPLQEGSETIVLNASIGEYRKQAEFKIYVESDITSTWVEISTKAQLLDFVYGVSDQSKNYYLSADIDMEGMYVESGKKDEATTTFKGKFDGRGHTIKNYKVEGTQEGKAYNNAALIHKLDKGAAVRNLTLECEVDEKGSGWGSTPFIGVGVSGCIVDNCLINVNHSYDNGLNIDANNWFGFNSAIFGSGAGNIYDTVVNIEDNAGRGSIYADYAYPNNDSKITKNLYTNTSTDFIGGQTWDWGTAITDFEGYNPGISFEATSADFYDLNEHAWNLVDNQMPTLKVLD